MTIGEGAQSAPGYRQRKRSASQESSFEKIGTVDIDQQSKDRPKRHKKGKLEMKREEANQNKLSVPISVDNMAKIMGSSADYNQMAASIALQFEILKRMSMTAEEKSSKLEASAASMAPPPCSTTGGAPPFTSSSHQLSSSIESIASEEIMVGTFDCAPYSSSVVQSSNGPNASSFKQYTPREDDGNDGNEKEGMMNDSNTTQ